MTRSRAACRARRCAQLDNFWGNFDNALALVIQKNTDPAKAAADACAAMNKANKIS